MRRLAILGSTGSIGVQVLAVAALYPERFRVTALIAGQNAEKLFEQARVFRPKLAGLVQEPEQIPEDLKGIDWVFGADCLRAAASFAEADDVLVAVVGFAGLPAVLTALEAGKRVLLANKEALVAGGALVTARAGEEMLLPVDSEHSAIFQCLRASDGNAPEKLILTASGGPFRTWDAPSIARATASQALRHPNWSMGSKITVDSASMMNKALEVIEARWLFGLPPERIEVLIHPQSVVHSLVAFSDGALLAQLGTPDMRLPILYAMAFPERLPTGGERLDLARVGQLTFEKPDPSRFPCLNLGYEALKMGGTACAMLSAANEIAVEAFLSGRIPFGGVARTVSAVLEKLPVTPAPSVDAICEADARARRMANDMILMEA